jgi:hypothetical protein
MSNGITGPVTSNTALDILRQYSKPTEREESVLNDVLGRLGQNEIEAHDAMDELIDRLDWPLERAAAEVDAFLE